MGSESSILYPMVTLQLETGSRSGTVKKLPWKDVDFETRGLRWGKDKTPAGTNRTIPISQRAMAVLEMWAENFPKRKPNHYVFSNVSYRVAKKTGGRGAKVVSMEMRDCDPTQHITSVQRSWGTALRRAG